MLNRLPWDLVIPLSLSSRGGWNSQIVDSLFEDERGFQSSKPSSLAQVQPLKAAVECHVFDGVNAFATYCCILG